MKASKVVREWVPASHRIARLLLGFLVVITISVLIGLVLGFDVATKAVIDGSKFAAWVRSLWQQGS